MKLKLRNISKITISIGLAIVLFSFISFIEKQADNRICSSIIVEIDNQFENYPYDEFYAINILPAGLHHNYSPQRKDLRLPVESTTGNNP